MNKLQLGCLLLGLSSLGGSLVNLKAATFSTPYGTSRQVNVNALGLNTPGDAANEPSLCIDPTNPNRIAVGWRQFDTTNSIFRQSGVAYTTNGGLNWTYPGNLEAGTFRSDPVLASDANGVFYYLGISNSATFAEDLLRSTNGGATWQLAGPALGGDKEWMVIDTTTGPGRGNIYQVWSPFYNVYNGNENHIFTRSTDGGASWMPAIGLPHAPYWGTLDVGPNGELYMFGTAIDIEPFILNRATNAQAAVVPVVVPNANASIPGGVCSTYPFDIITNGIANQHYQQVYSSSQFAALPSGGAFINAIAFRPCSAFSATLPSVTISLSTSPKAPDGLSATFANNVGPNNTVVFNGSLSWGSAGSGFDAIFTLETPFFYNPAAGNLLLDVINNGGGETNAPFDAVPLPADSVSRAYGSVSSSTATTDTTGLVTEFIFGPIDLTSIVDLGGTPLFGTTAVNPGGLLGQAWIAADRSSGPTRGNLYALCTVTTGSGNPCDVMFSRSTDRGQTWSAPLRINDDSATQNAYHWFGTLSVAPNGRVDACWNDTRHSADNSLSELYYSWSNDGGLTWATNRPLSPQFNQSAGFINDPSHPGEQHKMGDYMGMISLNECACIAYAATFNGEEDIYFVRAELPITAVVTAIGGTARISWNSVLGGNYCVQVATDLSVSFASGSTVGCVTATNNTAYVDDPLAASGAPRFYRVVRQP